jgi:signal transduction histidine kinase
MLRPLPSIPIADGTGRPSEPRAVVWIAVDGAAEAERVRAAVGAEHEALAGSELLDRLAGGAAPDVVVLGAGGRETCRRLRLARNGLDLPILMLVGARSAIAGALAAGASDALAEPWDAAELSARVTALSRTRRLHAAVLEAERARGLAQTERERRRAEEASRLKDEFLATISHELRTPLTAILGWSRMLVSDTLPEAKQRRALEAIDRNARAQTRLVEDLLDVSRGLTGEIRLALAPVELVPIVEAAVEAVRPAAEAKGLSLRTALDDSVGPVLGDAARLQQAFYNLVANAVKFTPRGGAVRVRLDHDGEAARLVVEDDGQGIRAEFLPHVFDRFRQADGSATRAHGGLGIGLSIARDLISLHGGTLEAHSEGEHRGAAFEVSLPLVQARSGAFTPEPTGTRVVVEDVPDSCTRAGHG